MAVHCEIVVGDTDPQALEVWLRLQREMPAGRKLALVFELSELVLKLAEAGVRAQFPQAGEREVFLRAAARRLGRDLMIRVYGWDPDNDGGTRQGA